MRYLVLIICIVFSTSIASAIPSDEAQNKVKNLPCKTGGTVDEHLTKKADIPAMDDMGWSAYPLDDGAFHVERFMILSDRMRLIYRWHVDTQGNVTAVNGKAKSITVPNKYTHYIESRDKANTRIDHKSGDNVVLRNKSDDAFAIHKDAELSNITNLFSNGIKATIKSFKTFPDKPTAYKVQLTLGDGSIYNGWVPGNVINN
ncbi:MAG: hypothetical protein D8M57_13025 [Candidatus Scalindua sp. AMX11]|nr:hypothetical protein [Planctomycetota bacterium]RZV82961.1 MAG: hypothetical protein EX341_09220 [Candidatus Scalindua sp. SCAELEC01]TDE64417.1 MAG: hypothetical protein D8M57_13025 [Candidatus Scalindua sp. AMX11]